MPLKPLDGAHQRPDLLAIGDRSEVLHLGRRQSVPKICRQIMLRPSGCYRVTKHPPA